jgi:hypothetical protein
MVWRRVRRAQSAMMWSKSPVEYGRQREDALRRGHFGGCICAPGPDCFALGIPAAAEGCERCTPVRVSASDPPLPELLMPSRTLSGTFDANLGSPYGCLSMRWHDHLLPENTLHL